MCLEIRLLGLCATFISLKVYRRRAGRWEKEREREEEGSDA